MNTEQKPEALQPAEKLRDAINLIECGFSDAIATNDLRLAAMELESLHARVQELEAHIAQLTTWKSEGELEIRAWDTMKEQERKIIELEKMLETIGAGCGAARPDQYAKHTPGPWVILKGYDGTVEVSASRPYRINNISAGTPLICDVYQHPEFDGFSSQANANLIAAAPDLLEALERLKCEVILSDVDMDYIKTHFQPHLDKASAAIAKATGAASSAACAAQGTNT